MSVRLRLAAVFTLATIVLVALGAYVFVGQLRRSLENSLDESLQAQAGTIAAALANDPSPGLSNGFGGVAQLYDRDGTLLRSSAALAGARLLTAEQVRQAVASGTIHADRSADLRTKREPGPQELRVYGMRARRSTVVIATAASRDLVDDAVQQTQQQITIVGLVVVVLAGPGSWLLARAALRPVERMRARVAALDPARVAAGVEQRQARDEISRLGTTFNELVARLHAALQRERAFVADAGHELRTPLTVLKGEFELAQRPGRSREDLLETVEVAAEETDRLIRVTENLLLLAREDDESPHDEIDLADLAHDSVAAAEGAAAARSVTLALRDDGVGVVTGDADRLRRAFDNLVANAIHYSPTDGTVTVRLGCCRSEAVVEVSDDGPGFAPEFLPRAFERFARADDARTRDGGGSGLGLAIVAAIMQGHGGTAEAGNRPNGGAIVTLRWPADVRLTRR